MCSFAHPAWVRIKETGRYALFTAARVECDLYTEVSIPAAVKDSLIHLEIVCDVTRSLVRLRETDEKIIFLFP